MTIREQIEQLFRKPISWIAGEVIGRLMIAPWYIWVWRMICKPLSLIAMVITFILTLLLNCTGI